MIINIVKICKIWNLKVKGKDLKEKEKIINGN